MRILRIPRIISIHIYNHPIDWPRTWGCAELRWIYLPLIAIRLDWSIAA